MPQHAIISILYTEIMNKSGYISKGRSCSSAKRWVIVIDSVCIRMYSTVINRGHTSVSCVCFIYN